MARSAAASIPDRSAREVACGDVRQRVTIDPIMLPLLFLATCESADLPLTAYSNMWRVWRQRAEGR